MEKWIHCLSLTFGFFYSVVIIFHMRFFCCCSYRYFNKIFISWNNLKREWKYLKEKTHRNWAETAHFFRENWNEFLESFFCFLMFSFRLFFIWNCFIYFYCALSFEILFVHAFFVFLFLHFPTLRGILKSKQIKS